MRILFMLAATAALLIGGVHADSCFQCACSPAVTTPPTWIDITRAGPSSSTGIYYVQIDACVPEPCDHVWVYQETNGIDGLQRKDAVIDDTCGGAIAPDTVVNGA